MWIIKEAGDVILVPEADQAYNQYDLAIAPHIPAESAWCGIVTNGVAAGEEYTMRVTEGIQIDTDDLEDDAVFNTFGQQVWYNPTNKMFGDTEDAGMWLVGYVILPTDSNGFMRFEKRRYAIPGEAT